MKKIVAITLPIAMLVSLAAASEAEVRKEESPKFYFTAGTGVFLKTKMSSDYAASRTIQGVTIPENNLDYKAKGVSELFAGVGYYVTDKLKIETTFIKPWTADLRFSPSPISVDAPDGSTNSFDYGFKQKFDINAVQAKAYLNVADLKEFGSLYLGSGLGFSKINTKITFSASGTDSYGDPIASGDAKIASKNSNSLNWMLGSGVNFDVSDGMKLSIGYEYQNFGKSKSFEVNDSDGNLLYREASKSFKGHGATVRLICDI
jgi:opacity protein-like surface antigen